MLALTVSLMAALTFSVATPPPAGAKSPPVKLVLQPERIGVGVHEITLLCGESKGAECQAGTASHAAGGFEFPSGVATAPNGDIYVADTANHRVQKLNPNAPPGEQFLLMFGKNVKKSGGNVCASAEAPECQAGVAGGEPGALSEPESVVVEAGSEDIYVLDRANSRVDKYGPDGEFLLMFGKNVKKGGGDICTSAETKECQAGTEGELESSEVSFNLAQDLGDLLAMGEPGEHVIYVGDAHRVEEFGPLGEPKGEVKLPATVIGSKPQGHTTAVTAEAGRLYVIYETQPTVHQFDIATKLESNEFAFGREGTVGRELKAAAMTTDSVGHLAVIGSEESSQTGAKYQFGLLYKTDNDGLLTSFTVPGELFHAVRAAAFTSDGKTMYAMAAPDDDVMIYHPEPVGEPITNGPICLSGPEHETNLTYNCQLHGEIDPWGITETEAWFQWGRSPGLGNETPHQPIENEKKPPVAGQEEKLVPVQATVEGVRPHEELFYYRSVAVDHNVLLPELLTGSVVSFATPIAPPKIVSAPSERFVAPTSAVLFGELNPENDSTTYRFQYARYDEGTCPRLDECAETVQQTTPLTSAAYGRLGVTAEADNLRPNTEYLFRLYAENAGGVATDEAGEPQLPEGRFKTLEAPRVSAETGTASSVTATSALISGTVSSGGQASIYDFEVGVDTGPSIHYGVVSSGAAGASAGFETESRQLTGLRPATRYAFRISAHFGDGAAPGSSAVGATHVFETSEEPGVLLVEPAVEQLPVPPIKFPGPIRQPTRAELLKKALKACGKKPRSKRSRCQREARKRYGAKGARA